MAKLSSDFELVVKKYSDIQMMMVNKIRKTTLSSSLTHQVDELQSNMDAQLMQQQQLQYQLQVDDARSREQQMNQILVGRLLLDPFTEIN